MPKGRQVPLGEGDWRPVTEWGKGAGMEEHRLFLHETLEMIDNQETMLYTSACEHSVPVAVITNEEGQNISVLIAQARANAFTALLEMEFIVINRRNQESQNG